MSSTAPAGPSISPTEKSAGQALQCSACGSSDIRRSQSRNLFDGLVRTLGLRPYRCRACRVRFFAKAPKLSADANRTTQD